MRGKAAWLALVTLLLTSVDAQNNSAMKLTCDGQSTIRANTLRADLVRLFGEANVKDDEVYVGEGFSEPGTFVFPDELEKRVEIIWRKDGRGPQSVRTPILLRKIAENSQREDSPHTSKWRGPAGLALGTPLKEVERINRRPFLLAGFEWDYSGTVISWKGGWLERKGTGCFLQLRLEPSGGDAEEIRKVSSDNYFSSGHPSMQNINPRIYQMILHFEEPPRPMKR